MHDRIRVNENGQTLELSVCEDPMRIVAGLNQVQSVLKKIDNETPDADALKTAHYFSEVIFGAEQADKLCEFYRNDPSCVINVCGTYFRDRLSKLITKAQKKAKKARK